jgi:alkylresorcinol/alkylpyrone synthase
MTGTAPRLVAVATAAPEPLVPQAVIRAAVERLFTGGAALSRLLQVFDHSGIETRSVCMPLEWYAEPRTFGEQNTLYIEHALRLGSTAAVRALEDAGLEAGAVDHIVFVSTTGLATPSLDARLSLVLGCRAGCRRTPIWGLGCAGGAAGVSRARDLALADPAAVVLLVAVELCTLTFRHADRDARNLVATSLFSDGAAAAVVTGARAPRGTPNGGARTRRPLELVASCSTLWPDTLDVMGWDVSEQGLHVVFSRDIPAIARERVKPFLEQFLSREGLGLADVAHVVAHPGGAKVLEAYAASLGWPESGLSHARAELREHGNLSSPSCLFVLERFLEAGDIAEGDHALLLALGPGFSAESVLLRGAAAG